MKKPEVQEMVKMKRKRGDSPGTVDSNKKKHDNIDIVTLSDESDAESDNDIFEIASDDDAIHVLGCNPRREVVD